MMPAQEILEALLPQNNWAALLLLALAGLTLLAAVLWDDR